LHKELTYFRNQRHRMNYAAYLRENLPIASGVVEAACKTLVTPGVFSSNRQVAVCSLLW